MSSTRPVGPTGRAAAGPLARPIFVVGPPKSGARLIAAALRALGGCWTVAGGAAGALLAGAPELDPPDGAGGGRLAASDGPAGVRQRVRSHLLRQLGGSTSRPRGQRLFDASPRNALMIPFLRAVFPDATFVYVHRQAADALTESLAAWRAGTAVTYPALPGWTGPGWSFLLVPGWRELIGRPLAEVVTEQWIRTMRILLADLEGLPPPLWCVTEHDALLEDPRSELDRLLGFLRLRTTPAAAAALGRAASGVVSADRRIAPEELVPYLARTVELADRAGDWIAQQRAPVSGAES